MESLAFEHFDAFNGLNKPIPLTLKLLLPLHFFGFGVHKQAYKGPCQLSYVNERTMQIYFGGRFVSFLNDI